MRGDLHVAIGERGNELRSPKLVSAGGVIEERIQIARLPALRVEGRTFEVPKRGMREREPRPSGLERAEGQGAPCHLRRIEEVFVTELRILPVDVSRTQRAREVEHVVHQMAPRSGLLGIAHEAVEK